MPTKHIFVLGGVVSSLGKGILSAAIGKVLQSRSYKIQIQKLDPYLNVDPGTLNPYEHGECFVTQDGSETDLDLGHYERFLGICTSKTNNITTGQIYQNVINRERKGGYKGKTVQVIPHITSEIKRHILQKKKYKDCDIVITEVGGTVGDIESLPFIEAVRQLQLELPKKDRLVILLTLVPRLKSANELKTKPTQHSVKMLQENGIHPDVIVCRIEEKGALNTSLREKISLFCNVPSQHVIEARDEDSIYKVPDSIIEQRLDTVILNQLCLPKNRLNITRWHRFLEKQASPTKQVVIGIVGKYIELQDAYKSILESLVHAGAHHRVEVKKIYIHSEKITNARIKKVFSSLDGILIGPGFGYRGIEGKIKAIQYGREHQVPLLGICLGMQLMYVEFARNVLGIKHAHSTEFSNNVPYTVEPVIDLMAGQKTVKQRGGTMRLGGYECTLKKGTVAYRAYERRNINERHRHRYEINPAYLPEMKKKGVIASGLNPKLDLIEIIEYAKHPFGVGIQFHPEYKSTPEIPHPLFREFVKISSQD